MLRKNPEQMIFYEDLTEKKKTTVLSDITKVRNKQAFSDLKGLTEEELKKRDKDAADADRRAEKYHMRDRLYGKDFKDIQKLNCRRKKWKKHQKKIGREGTWAR